MNSDTRKDEELQRTVLAELEWDTRVSAARIGVAVTGGVVTLSGTVPSFLEKVAAQEAAHRVAGVKDVANDISVDIPGDHERSDTEIARAVRRALEGDAFAPDERIRSTVTKGWVELEGDVDTESQREDAEAAVRRLKGVRGVSNAIEIRSSSVSAHDVLQAIEGALGRRARREARHIDVDVKNGTVTLSGRVSSLPEKRAVLGVVRHTRGVRSVASHLLLDPLH